MLEDKMVKRRELIPDNIYPARGRKLFRNPAIKNFKLFDSRQYLPRKGTETSICLPPYAERKS